MAAKQGAPQSASAAQARLEAADLSARITNLQDRISAAEAQGVLIRKELFGLRSTSQLAPPQQALKVELQAQLASNQAEVAAYKESMAILRGQSIDAQVQDIANSVVPNIAGSSVPPYMSKEVMVISGLFTMFVLGPLSIALAVRFVRRGWSSRPEPQLTDMSDRVRRIETAVETMAIEVERVSESQRYLVRTLGDESKLAAPKG